MSQSRWPRAVGRSGTQKQLMLRDGVFTPGKGTAPPAPAFSASTTARRPARLTRLILYRAADGCTRDSRLVRLHLTFLPPRPAAGRMAPAPVRRRGHVVAVRPAPGVPGARPAPRRAARALRLVRGAAARPVRRGGARVHAEPGRRPAVADGAAPHRAGARPRPPRRGARPPDGRLLARRRRH